MTQFLIKDTLIPPYMAFPRFLLDMEQLSETAKILYVLLLDRARLSQKNEGWVDERGRASYSFQSRIWQKPCTKAKCLLRPLWQFWKKRI